jgi:DNA-binding NtrC family response regulator
MPVLGTPPPARLLTRARGADGRKPTEDISPLVARFLSDLGDPGATERIDPPSLDRLMCRDWPGNIRELRNVIVGAHAQSHGGTIEVADLLNARKAILISVKQSDAVRDALLPGNRNATTSARLFKGLRSAPFGETSCEATARTSPFARGVPRTKLRDREERVEMQEASARQGDLHFAVAEAGTAHALSRPLGPAHAR